MEKVKMTDLIKYQNNSKIHTQEQIDQVKASIQEFGYISPIIVDENNVILAGHGRYEALLQLKYEDVEIKRVTNLTEIQKKQYVLADNKLNMNTGFDEEMLKLELEAITQSGEEIDITGFGMDEVERIMGEGPAEGETDPEEEENEYTDFESEKPKSLKYITICGKKIPITEVEEEHILELVNEYANEKGTFYGFWGDL